MLSQSFPVDLSFVLGGFLLEPVTELLEKHLGRGKTFTTNGFTGGYSFISDLASPVPGC